MGEWTRRTRIQDYLSRSSSNSSGGEKAPARAHFFNFAILISHQPHFFEVKLVLYYIIQTGKLSYNLIFYTKQETADIHVVALFSYNEIYVSHSFPSFFSLYPGNTFCDIQSMIP